MLKCDFCHAHWHLDCLDPPLANPPHISLEASQRDAWRCPRHIEHDLRSGQLYQNDLNILDGDEEMADTEPAARVTRKIRKRKDTKIIEPTFSRGMRNNGLIEIINNPDDDTDGEGNYVFGPDDPKDLNAKVFRLPEQGVILDFVSKVKRYVHLSCRVITTVANVSYSARVVKQNEARKAAAQRKAEMQNFITRPMSQQQAALHLVRLANKETDIGLAAGKLDVLLYTLTVRLPPCAPHLRCFGSPALTRVPSGQRCHRRARQCCSAVPRRQRARTAAQAPGTHRAPPQRMRNATFGRSSPERFSLVTATPPHDLVPSLDLYASQAHDTFRFLSWGSSFSCSSGQSWSR
jgi:hypothetical protein